jgi:hypothetical protein
MFVECVETGGVRGKVAITIVSIKLEIELR